MSRDQYHHIHDYRALRRHADQLHRLLETGEFWRRPYAERRKLVRRMNKLYNRLLSPFGRERLRPILATAGVLTIASCALFNDPPTVSIAEGDQTVKQGYVATFTAEATDPNEDPITYSWSINGEPLAGETGESVLLSYEQIGEYSVEVTADDGIERSVAQATLTVTPAARNPQFGAPQTNPFGLSKSEIWYGYAHVTLTDIDDDGDLDLVYFSLDDDPYTEPYAALAMRENTGSPTSPHFAEPSKNPHGLTTQPYNPLSATFDVVATPTFADLDDDGDLDAVAYAYDTYARTYQFAFIQNVGSATVPDFASPVPGQYGLPQAFTLSAELADIDADGDHDLLYTAGTSLWLSENTGDASNPSFAAATTPFNPAINPPVSSQICLGDIDDDGDLDLFIGKDNSPYIDFHENSGSPTTPVFEPAVVNPFGIAFPDGVAFVYGMPALGDIDGDGDLDLIPGITLPSGYISYFDWDFVFLENTNL